MNNVLLTGERQVGKSTLIQYVLDDFPGLVCGFRTMPQNGLHCLKPVGLTGYVKKKYYICERGADGRLKGNTAFFDHIGAQILKDCLANKPDLILMDELGIFESEAYLFQEQVLDCLNSGIPVLGVIKDKPSPFLDLLRKRDDAIVLRIMKDNRNKMKKILKNLVAQFCVY